MSGDMWLLLVAQPGVCGGVRGGFWCHGVLTCINNPVSDRSHEAAACIC
jgi:hypothetical protein